MQLIQLTKADDADATDERKKQKQTDDNDYEEPDSDEEKRDAANKDSDNSDDEFDVSRVKLEVDDAFDVSMMQQKVQPNDDDVEQLEEIERKEEELIMEKAGDKEILELLAKFSSAHLLRVREFDYDKVKHSWVEIRFEAPIKFKNLDVTNIIRELARASTIHEVPKIKRAFVDRQKNGLVVTTEGINIGVSRLNSLTVKSKNKSQNQSSLSLIKLRRCSNTIKFSTSISSTQTTSMLSRELMALRRPLESSSRRCKMCSTFTAFTSIRDTCRSSPTT